MEASFDQLGRIFSVGFPGSVVVPAAEMLKKMKRCACKDAAETLVGTRRLEVFLCMHKVTHCVRKSGCLV